MDIKEITIFKGSLRSVVANMLDCYLVESEFEF